MPSYPTNVSRDRYYKDQADQFKAYAEQQTKSRKPPMPDPGAFDAAPASPPVADPAPAPAEASPSPPQAQAPYPGALPTPADDPNAGVNLNDQGSDADLFASWLKTNHGIDVSDPLAQGKATTSQPDALTAGSSLTTPQESSATGDLAKFESYLSDQGVDFGKMGGTRGQSAGAIPAAPQAPPAPEQNPMLEMLRRTPQGQTAEMFGILPKAANDDDKTREADSNNVCDPSSKSYDPVACQALQMAQKMRARVPMPGGGSMEVEFPSPTGPVSPAAGSAVQQLNQEEKVAGEVPGALEHVRNYDTMLGGGKVGAAGGRVAEEATPGVLDLVDQGVSPGKIADAVPGYLAGKAKDAASGAVEGVKEATRRFYHGTGSAFDTPDAAKFDPAGLFGPGYYLTSDPRVASDYANKRAPSGADLEYYQAILDKYGPVLKGEQPEFYRRAQEALSAGPNVRAVNVPEGLNMIDADVPMTPDQFRTAAEGVASAMGDDPYATYVRSVARQAANYPADSLTVDMIRQAARPGAQQKLDWATTNKGLSAAGFDGIKYAGGQRIPLRDDAGNAIEHDAVVVFPESLPKINNAISGTAMGAFAGVGTDEQGNPTFSPERAALGVVGGTLAENPGVRRALGRAGEAILGNVPTEKPWLMPPDQWRAAAEQGKATLAQIPREASGRYVPERMDEALAIGHLLESPPASVARETMGLTGEPVVDPAVAGFIPTLPPSDLAFVKSLNAYTADEEAGRQALRQGRYRTGAVNTTYGLGRDPGAVAYSDGTIQVSPHKLAEAQADPQGPAGQWLRATVAHEVGHTIYNNLPEPLKREWETAVHPHKEGASDFDNGILLGTHIQNGGEAPPTTQATINPSEDFVESYRIFRGAGKPDDKPLGPQRTALLNEVAAWLEGAGAPAEAAGPTRALSPQARQVVEAYSALSAKRAPLIKQRALDWVGNEVGRPDLAPLFDRTFEATKQQLQGAKTVFTALNQHQVRELAQGGAARSKFGALTDRDAAARAAYATVNGFPYDAKAHEGLAPGARLLDKNGKERERVTLQEAEGFNELESLADRLALGSTEYLGRDENPVPRIYARVTEGELMPDQSQGLVYVKWRNDTPRVSTLHHHFGFVAPNYDAHSNMADAFKNELWKTDTADRVPLGDGREVLNTPWLVGPEAEDDLRAAALMMTMPVAVRSKVESGEIRDPQTLASVLLRGSMSMNQPLKAEAVKAGVALTTDQLKKAGLPEDYRFHLAQGVNSNRTESLILEPNLANVEAIYVVGPPGSLTSQKGAKKGDLNSHQSAEALARAVREQTGQDVPVITTPLVPGMKKQIDPTLSPGRAGIVERYKAAGFPDIGLLPRDLREALNATPADVKEQALAAGAGAAAGQIGTDENTTPGERVGRAVLGAEAGLRARNLVRGITPGISRELGAAAGPGDLARAAQERKLQPALGGLEPENFARAPGEAPARPTNAVSEPPGGLRTPGFYRAERPRQGGMGLEAEPGQSRGALERLRTARKASMLSSVATQVFNNLQNAVNLTSDTALKPLQAGLDAVASAKTGQRTRYQAEFGPQVLGTVAGLVDGAREFGEVLGGRIKAGEEVPTGARGSKVDTALEGVFRLMNAFDHIWRSGAFGGQAAALATRKATREGLSGTARANRAREILQNLAEHPDIVEQADKLAARSVYQEDRPQFKPLIEATRNPEIGTVTDLVVPFVKTPINVAAQQAGMSPLGLLSVVKAVADGNRAVEAARKVGGDAGAAARIAQGSTVDRASRAVAGAGAMGLAFGLAQAGYVTGGYPTDKAEQDTLPEGWKPYSLRIPAGDGAVYVPLPFFGPFGLALASGAIIGDAKRRAGQGEDPDRLTALAVRGLGKYAQDQLFLQGIVTVSNIITEPDRYVEHLTEGLAAPYVPLSGLLRQIDQIAGNPQRDPKGAIESLFAATGPIAGGKVRAKRTALGDDRVPTVTGPAAALVGSRIGVEKDEPTLKLFREARVTIPDQGRTVTVDLPGGLPSVTYPITEDEQRSIQKRAGELLRERTKKYADSASFAAMPVDRRAGVLENVREAAFKQARGEFVKTLPADEKKRRAAVARDAKKNRRPVPNLD